MGKDTEDKDRGRKGEKEGAEEVTEKWSREAKAEMPESLRRRVTNVGLPGWVKGALVPIKSHYCGLITQGSCCLYRYEQWLWYMNNSAGKKDTGIRDTVAYGWAFAKGPRDITQRGKKHQLIHIAVRSDLTHP